jgi:hypothetical protein
MTFHDIQTNYNFMHNILCICNGCDRNDPEAVKQWRIVCPSVMDVVHKLRYQIDKTIEDLAWNYLSDVGVFDPCEKYKRETGDWDCDDCDNCDVTSWKTDPTHEALMDLLIYLDSADREGVEGFVLNVTRENPDLIDWVKEYFDEVLHQGLDGFKFCTEAQFKFIREDFLDYLRFNTYRRYIPSEE